MKKRAAALQPTRVLAIAATAAVLLLTACGGDKSATANAAVPPATNAPPAAAAASAGFGNGTAPDTSGMGQIIIGKINAQPAVEGKATLVEFRQKSIESDPIGDSVMSAVVEFEARAEYVNQGKGWELVPPMGIYPL